VIAEPPSDVGAFQLSPTPQSCATADRPAGAPGAVAFGVVVVVVVVVVIVVVVGGSVAAVAEIVFERGPSPKELIALTE
jgi:hypothetical protein